MLYFHHKMNHQKMNIQKSFFQDFVHHFHVLLPRGTSPTKSGVREFFRRIHLPPAGYQVGSTMVRILEIINGLSFSLYVFLKCPMQWTSATSFYLMFLYDAGVPARGRAPASSDPPAPGGPAENRHAAAPLQGSSGEEALCQHETSCVHHSGETL